MEAPFTEHALAQLREVHEKVDRLVERFAALEASISVKLDGAVVRVEGFGKDYESLTKRVLDLELANSALRSNFKMLAWIVTTMCLALPPLAGALIAWWMG